jgi:high-affinity iron transporter
MGIISIALLNEDNKKAISHLHELKQLFQQYKNGDFKSVTANQKDGTTLSVYIKRLEKTKILLENKQWVQAQQQIKTLQSEWLSVEGDVVSQSQKVYTQSEKDLVLMAAYVSNPDGREKTVDLINEMIFSLKPLAETDYGLWDAALIPIREGLEALLVVGALLAFAKKADSSKAKRWIWGGTLSGMGLSLIVGFTVSIILSSIAFGNNNAMINGWSGVIASVMLLYVSYWLHRNSNIRRWNQFIQSKSKKAMSTGRMLSFSIIAFLAILREGMETVIFLIGMANRMSAAELIGGIAAGFTVLVIIGFLMFNIGVKLPLKPFFLISSFIVFYLCLKFMGSGIHSLQMAGVLPSTVHDYLPSISLVSLFPSWYSTLPQAIFLLIAIVVILKNQWQKRKQTSNEAKEAI